MIDPNLLMTALTAGASIAGKQLVEDATKDAYKGLKSAVARIFGVRAERAVDGLEQSPNDATATQKLEDAIPAIEPEDASDLETKVTALLDALQSDPHAKDIVEKHAIKLNVDAGGHVIIERLRGVEDLDVKAKAAGDFKLNDVDMGRGKTSGN